MTESELAGDLETSDGRMDIGTLLWIAAAITTMAVVLFGFVAMRMWSTEDIRVQGLPDHPLTATAVSQGTIQVQAASAAGMHISIDGRPTGIEPKPGGLALRMPGLPNGVHELHIDVPRNAPWLGSATKVQQFVIDNDPPELQVDDSLRPDGIGKPVTVKGIARGASRVTIADQQVIPDNTGAFSGVVRHPDREVLVVATDAAGNRAEKTMTVHIKHPGMRAVHMTGLAWTSDTLREPVLELARQHKIDTVELDIKDEDGAVVYDSQLPGVQQIGAAKGYYKARAVLDQLHGMGVRVVGRLVAFKDPILGAASWHSGHPERVVQTASGQPWSSGYGSMAFTNFANPYVRQYNIDIAAEAAKLGFDDVLYDYVRRPDGAIDQMRFAGLSMTPEQSIADFLRQTQVAVRSDGALLGASVFGISVNRPTQIAQDIKQMSQYVDYIAPMVYPSHWGPGEFNVANPNGQPYEIVQRSLAEFAKSVQGTDVQIIPWLQDFSLGASYGPPEVTAQINAAKDDNMRSFLLWAPNCRYHDQSLIPG